MNAHEKENMSPVTRRIIYVLSYEAIAILFVSVSLTLAGLGGGNSTLIAVVSSVVAVIWNFIWNTLLVEKTKIMESFQLLKN